MTTVFSDFDYQCMSDALRLARKGLDSTHPNPRVGCVLARDDEVVGTGWHEAAGGPHAEIMALESARGLAEGATAYVTLEPCSHHGRTPPCTAALHEAGISRVVMATLDPNPRVNGGGKKALEQSGVICDVGLMHDQAETLNAGFFKRMREGKPFVRLKLAQSLDGRSALANGESQWITGKAARADGQLWRAQASAVMTGIGTILADDPSLNVRLPQCARQPVRVICDSEWRTPLKARTLQLAGEVWILGREDRDVPTGLREYAGSLIGVSASDHGISLGESLKALAEREINEVHVEAGGRLSGALLDEGLVDEILLYLAPCTLGADAQPAVAMQAVRTMGERREFEMLECINVGQDLRLRLTPLRGAA